MNRELKTLLATEVESYPAVFAKISNGEMTYDEFYEWANILTTQRYFCGKQAVMVEHKKDIPNSVRKIYLDKEDF
jgi:hypothetical protein